MLGRKERETGEGGWGKEAFPWRTPFSDLRNRKGKVGLQ